MKHSWMLSYKSAYNYFRDLPYITLQASKLKAVIMAFILQICPKNFFKEV